MSAERLSQSTEDAITNLLMTRLAERGHYDDFLDAVPPADRAAIEDALERHAAHRRAAGEPGW
ncbi:hypothetical protein [Polymorphospora sp. NPDC050346]|uniref:hypothetical protein n=1 Tax=Polymorphospora sp. NPDC050346 TaxID=3155780 RepID=UPI0033D86975